SGAGSQRPGITTKNTKEKGGRNEQLKKLLNPAPPQSRQPPLRLAFSLSSSFLAFDTLGFLRLVFNESCGQGCPRSIPPKCRHCRNNGRHSLPSEPRLCARERRRRRVTHLSVIN